MVKANWGVEVGNGLPNIDQMYMLVHTNQNACCSRELAKGIKKPWGWVGWLKREKHEGSRSKRKWTKARNTRCGSPDISHKQSPDMFIASHGTMHRAGRQTGQNDVEDKDDPDGDNRQCNVLTSI